ncbi:endonuclease domain-containing protein [Candidatus Cloacimonadota bacterium]
MLPYNKKLIPKARELRKNQSKTEMRLWNYILRNRQLEGYKFLSQKPILNYIVDFYCSKLLLAIELDGEIHEFRIPYDEVRSKQIENLGIEIIRLNNEGVQNDIDEVRICLVNEIRTREIELKIMKPPRSPFAEGE